MNAQQAFNQTHNLARVVSIKKNEPTRGVIFTLRFGGAPIDYTQPRPHARATDFVSQRNKRTGIEGCGPDLFFAEWDFVD